MASFCIPAHLYALPRCNAFLFAPLKGVCESTVVEQEAYWLRCQRYIELNPREQDSLVYHANVRAGLTYAPVSRWMVTVRAKIKSILAMRLTTVICINTTRAINPSLIPIGAQIVRIC